MAYRKDLLESLLKEMAEEFNLMFTLIEHPPEQTGLKATHYDVRWKQGSGPWLDCFPMHRFGTAVSRNQAIAQLKAWRLGFRAREMTS
jgi:hypothetical protein